MLADVRVVLATMIKHTDMNKLMHAMRIPQAVQMYRAVQQQMRDFALHNNEDPGEWALGGASGLDVDVFAQTPLCFVVLCFVLLYLLFFGWFVSMISVVLSLVCDQSLRSEHWAVAAAICCGIVCSFRLYASLTTIHSSTTVFMSYCSFSLSVEVCAFLAVFRCWPLFFMILSHMVSSSFCFYISQCR